MKNLILVPAMAAFCLAPAPAWADGCAAGCVSGCDGCQTQVPACEPNCSEASPVCVNRRIECCHEKTRYRLVRMTEPVTRQREVCYRDPCDPCRIKRKIISEVHYRVRYRWVCEVRPACHTRTVRVCQWPERDRLAPTAAPGIPDTAPLASAAR